MMKFNLVLFLSVFIFASCQKDTDVVPEVPEVEVITPDPTVSTTDNSAQVIGLMTVDSAGCYEIVFPITFLFEDGSTQTAESEADLESIFTGPTPPINIGFPVNLQDPVTQETTTAANEEELGTLLSGCADYEVEPGDPTDPGYPTDPSYCDSTDINLGIIGCYDLVYPVTFTLEDGSTATAESDEDLANIFTSTNPPTGFGFPLNLISLIDSTSSTAASEDELEDLLEACDDFVVIGGGNDFPFVYPMTLMSVTFPQDTTGMPTCYAYQYPVSVTMADGDVETANDDTEMIAIIFGQEQVDNFVYPFSVTDNATGNTLVANDEEDVMDLVSNCN